MALSERDMFDLFISRSSVDAIALACIQPPNIGNVFVRHYCGIKIIGVECAEAAKRQRQIFESRTGEVV